MAPDTKARRAAPDVGGPWDAWPVTAAKGSVVVDELVVPVVDVYLANRKFAVVAKITGPARAVDSTDYVVCDRSGGVVYRSTGNNRLRWTTVEPGSTVIVTLELSIELEQVEGATR